MTTVRESGTGQGRLALAAAVAAGRRQMTVAALLAATVAGSKNQA
jgi:thioredoxin reductase